MTTRCAPLWLAFLTAMPLAARANTGWVPHLFGELRSCHGDVLTVRHPSGETVFSLRGLTKARNAIERHLERVSK